MPLKSMFSAFQWSVTGFMSSVRSRNVKFLNPPVCVERTAVGRITVSTPIAEITGSATVSDVLKYGERVCTKGLNLLEGPGNDMVAVTALAAAGAHIILFTTGRGTPLSSPVPTVKISSNSALAEKKKNWIDFDAGVITKTGDVRGCGEELFDCVMKLASGEVETKNEQTNKRGISIFKDGVTL